MTALTPTQIKSGYKGKQTPLPAPARTGRWRCWLCPNPVWRRGTDADGHMHYLTYHFDPDGEPS